MRITVSFKVQQQILQGFTVFVYDSCTSHQSIHLKIRYSSFKNSPLYFDSELDNLLLSNFLLQ